MDEWELDTIRARLREYQDFPFSIASTRTGTEIARRGAVRAALASDVPALLAEVERLTARLAEYAPDRPGSPTYDMLAKAFGDLIDERSEWERVVREMGADIERLTAERDAARERLDLARQALVATGYFHHEEVSSDVAPRIVELASAWRATLDQYRAVVTEIGALVQRWRTEDGPLDAGDCFAALEDALSAAEPSGTAEPEGRGQ